MRPMKYGVGSDRCLMPAGATLKHPAFLHKISFGMTALETLKPVRPSELVQIVKTIILGLKPFLKLKKADRNVVTHFYLQHKVSPIILV